MNVLSRRGLSLSVAVVVVVAALWPNAAVAADAVAADAVAADAAAAVNFDGIQMKGLVDDLLQVGFFNGIDMFGESVSCKDRNLAECYGLLNAAYADRISTRLVRMFYEKLSELLNGYNAAAREYINAVNRGKEYVDNKGQLKQPIAVDFSNSSAYCVLGFIDMHKIPGLSTSFQLSDYIFYHQLINLPNINTRTTFVERVNEYLQWRKVGSLNDSPKSSVDPTDNVGKAKDAINLFSNQFCKLQDLYGLKWMTGDAYTYASIRMSYPLTQIVIDGATVFSQKGLGVVASKDKSEDLVDPIWNFNMENKTLQDLMESGWDFKKYGQSHIYRRQVSSVLDRYVLDVLTVKMINIATSAMQFYYNSIKDLNTEKTNDKNTYEHFYIKHHYLRSMIRSFSTLILCYEKIEPVTLSRDTLNFIVGIIKSLMDSLEAQQTLEKEKENPTTKIEKLKGYLADPRFHLTGIPNERVDALNTIDDFILSAEKVIASLGHIAEEKSKN